MNDKELLEKFKMNIAINKLKNEHTQEDLKWRKYDMKKRVVATVCASVVLVSGVAFATNIENIKEYFHFRGLGSGIDSAIEQGYIANPEMEYKEAETEVKEENGTVLDNIKVDAKIEDFLMDDLNLSTQFYFVFDEKIKDYVDLDKLDNIELTDLIVTDEENRILYSGYDKKAFEKYCEKNGLNYVFGESNENYMNSGLNCFPSYHNKENNTVELTYNMYADGYPKSKKLKFTFGKITITEENNEVEKENKVILKGNWEIDMDVPEKMYSRTEEYYQVTNCERDNLDVYAAKVSDTGFEIGITVSNASRVENTKLDEISKIDDPEEYMKKMYELMRTPIGAEEENKNRPLSIYRDVFIDEEQGTDIEDIGCVENENGKKFECTMSPSRRANANFIDGNKFDYYETFGMTKKEATDKIKVVLLYYGEPVTIELEKVK